MPQPTKNHMELLPLEILHEILGHVRFPGMLNFGIAARGGPLATALAADPKWGVTWSICNGDRLQDYAKLWSFWGSEVGKSFYGLDTRFRYHWTVNPDGFPFDDSDPGDFLRYYCSTGHQDNAERLFQRVTMHIMEMVSMIDRDDLSDFVFSRDVLSERDIRQLAPWPRSLVYDYSTARQRCSRDGNLRETLFLALHGVCECWVRHYATQFCYCCSGRGLGYGVCTRGIGRSRKVSCDYKHDGFELHLWKFGEAVDLVGHLKMFYTRRRRLSQLTPYWSLKYRAP